MYIYDNGFLTNLAHILKHRRLWWRWILRFLYKELMRDRRAKPVVFSSSHHFDPFRRSLLCSIAYKANKIIVRGKWVVHLLNSFALQRYALQSKYITSTFRVHLNTFLHAKLSIAAHGKYLSARNRTAHEMYSFVLDYGLKAVVLNSIKCTRSVF